MGNICKRKKFNKSEVERNEIFDKLVHNGGLKY